MSRHNTQLIKIPLLLLFTSHLSLAQAEWSGNINFNTFYTDDIGLFSVTRRLSLEEDPTQPIVDEPNQGSDFIYEPSAQINWSTENELGEFQISAIASGYIFQDHSDYSHGSFELELEQNLSETSKIKVLYDFIPRLFLGKNELHTNSHSHSKEHHGIEEDEMLDNHIWAIHLEQKLTDNLILRALVRYGIRDYEQPFSHRDTQFFTVGPHLEWIITPDIELLVGYHFERGYTDHAKTIKHQDDIGYLNHFASAELKIRVLPQLFMNIIFDYEHNDYTSTYENDIHHDGNENVYQGEIELIYELTEATSLTVGWQHGNRKFNYETKNVHNNNVWIGAEYHF